MDVRDEGTDETVVRAADLHEMKIGDFYVSKEACEKFSGTPIKNVGISGCGSVCSPLY